MADLKEELAPGEDFKIRPQTPEEKERLNPDDSDVPSYRIKLNLNDEQEKRLIEEFFLEFEALKDERIQLKLEEAWKLADAQYDGELEQNKIIPFNLHMHQSKIKVDAIARALKEAFIDSDPIVDVSPRPETGRKDGYKVAEKQAQFIDFAMDEEIKPEVAIDKIIKSAIKKYVGIGKLCWAYRVEKRRREESYEGKNIPVAFVNGRAVIKNEGLEQFLTAYPDAMERYKGYVRRLFNEQKIDIVVNYKDTVENNAKFSHVKVEDFYVANATDYWDGLRTAHCVVERIEYSYWDLIKMQERGELQDVEKLWNTKKDGEEVNANDYKTRTYNLLHATKYFKLKEGEEEIKIKSFFGEDNKTFHGAILYPYYAFDIDYIPFYVELNDYGFYGNGKAVMSTLRDSNLAQNILLNLALYGFYLRNSVTPVVKEGSEAEALLDDNQIVPGKPIVVDGLTDDVNKAISFVQWPNIDINTMLVLMEMLKRGDSDVSKVSDLTSGRESAIDPSAPASKTIALLEQSGLGVKEYIRTFLPSFNIFCTMLLQLYYQMSQEGRKFQVRRKSEGITGADVFESISRDEMIVKTNVQARASAFVFDKVNEKREAIAALQLVRTDPFAIQQPIVQFEAFKNVLETFGPRWKNLVDKMPDPETFKKQQMQVAMQAIQMLMQQAQSQQQVTGVAPEVTPEMAGDAVTKAQAVSYNPALANPEATKK